MSGLQKSPWVIHYDASSCNGCDIEVLACLTPGFDVERFGIINTGNPKHADIFLVTGSVNERNREVVAVRFDTLLAIAERWGYLQTDPASVVAELKKLTPTAEEVADLLKKDVSKLRWQDARNALNSLGAKAVTSTAEGGLKGLLKIVFPFIPG